MKAKTYFEACGRRDRSRNPEIRRPSIRRLDHLPEWAQAAYRYGYVYQAKRLKR